MWHAKRMHMAEMWGYRVSLRRCDKSLRATYRFASRASTLHDGSYTECIEVAAPLSPLLSLLNAHMRPRIDTQRLAFEQRTFCYSPDGALMGSVRLLWRDMPGDEAQAWLFVHPAAAPEVFQCLSESKYASGFAIVHTRQQLLRYELRGPESHAVLHNALHLDPLHTDPAQARAWQALRHMSCDMVPVGAVLSVSIVDPRLFTPSRLPDQSLQPSLAEMMASAQACLVVRSSLSISCAQVSAQWPRGAASSGLWDQGVRQRLHSERASHKSICERRSKLMVPGGPLPVEPGDARIPILLVRQPGAPMLFSFAEQIRMSTLTALGRAKDATVVPDLAADGI
jgi:ribonuclease P/MRP protein subunit POP1